MSKLLCLLVFIFFFQAEDGIRDYKVTGVQTCALPISARPPKPPSAWAARSPPPCASPRCRPSWPPAATSPWAPRPRRCRRISTRKSRAGPLSSNRQVRVWIESCRCDDCPHEHTHQRPPRSEEHTSELQSPCNLVCR